jgi:hypothetical protein
MRKPVDHCADRKDVEASQSMLGVSNLYAALRYRRKVRLHA